MIRVYIALTLLLVATVTWGNQSPSTVKSSPSLMALIKIIEIGQAQVHDSLRLPARIELDQQLVARIGTTVTGRVTDIKAILGQEVKKGEQLATLNSTELSLAQSAYLKTSSQLNLRQLAVNRAKRLLAYDVIAAAELQEREAMLTEADVDLRTATDQLRVFGMSDKDLARLSKERKIHSFLPITTSLQGTIVERKVTVGQVVQPSDALFTVADLSHVWVVAELPEQDSSWAHKGDEAVATVAALPDQELHGRLIYVADVVDPNTRTVTLRMALPNPEHIFKPQMLATLIVRNKGQKQLVLPDSAVLHIGDEDFTFVQNSADEFELRPVKLGARDGNMRPIIGGLQLGEKVVVEGGFHLNSERLRKELE
ncbi:MAG: efflux RND transporter periplasmic adaptor subunit [Methylococcaceae bacterium]|jgi:cobalt-zinc-cadmium efflux system membrane fusion protein